jgi:hypothetical protein
VQESRTAGGFQLIDLADDFRQRAKELEKAAQQKDAAKD